jgi:hypothetical protein
MSQRPRIVFTRFASAESPKLAPWIAHIRHIVADTVADILVPASDGPIVWQLVTGNNRHLARSARIHGSFADAAASARAIVAASTELTVQHVSQKTRGAYGWYAHTDDVPAIVCARWYATARDCRASVALALRSLADAELHPGVLVVHHDAREPTIQPHPA